MRLATLAFLLGVLGLQFQPKLPDLWPLLAGGVVLAIACWFCRAQGWKARLLGVLAAALLGASWATWRAEIRLADVLPVAWEGQDIEVTGIVGELPQAFAQGTRFVFLVEEVATPGAIVPPKIMLSWYAPRAAKDTAALADDAASGPRPLHPGERWRLTVRLKRSHGNANPNAFDYEVWLFERGIRATGYVRPGPALRITPFVWRFGTVVEYFRDQVRQRFQALMPAETYPYGGILTALAIGDQQAIRGDLWNLFNRTGTTHLMSISGLHVTLVSALFGSLINFLWRRSSRLLLWCPAPRAAILAGGLAALAYTLLSGFSVPAQRTLYMLSVAGLSVLSSRNLGTSRTLALALMAVLLFDPWSVLAPGFWLSFGAVAALLYIGGQGTERAQGWRSKVAAWSSVQWAATLASLPILLLVFQQFSLISPLANAIAIPVVSLVVTPLALLAALLPWWPLTDFAHACMSGLMRFLEWCALAPVWQAPAPPLWAAAAALLGVAVLLLPRGVPGKFAGSLLLLPALFWPAPRPPFGAAWVDVLDVGQGLAIVVRTAQHTLLYDTGPLYSAESDAGQRVIVPYLRALGVDRVDTLVVTHRDTDHSGGVASVRAALPVTRLLSSVPELGGEACRAGQSWIWSGVEFSILHPSADDAANNDAKKGKANHVSCVLRIVAGGQRLLLTADIEAQDEAALLARSPAELAADILLVPHHGSKTSSTSAFLDAVGAKEAIVSAGYRNRFKHPRPEVLDRYAARGVNVWRSDRDGALLINLAADTSSISAWRQVHRRYWLEPWVAPESSLELPTTPQALPR